MSVADALSDAYDSCRAELIEARLLIPSGVRGVYALSGTFEDVIERFERFVTSRARGDHPEVLRFPPLFSRHSYEQTDHMETFPNLLGSVHSFMGDERQHQLLATTKGAGKDWTRHLSPTAVMLTPAACYPLYPTMTGTLPDGGRTVDLRSFVFRHEPSDDPARMQIFRQREVVRVGSPAQALSHRDRWLEEGLSMLRTLGLDVEAVVANDPFFGRGGRVMAATQREQTLKFEIVAPVASKEKLTAIASCNYHLDHFGSLFGIQTADGALAHTACIGFGLERIALALFLKHGFTPSAWPAGVREVLGI